MALMTVRVDFNPSLASGSVIVNADTLTEAKGKLATELNNRMSAQNAVVTALQNALNGVNG